jgi:hypothetical protein
VTRLAATLGIIWSIASLLMALVLIRGSFTAGTPAKEGPLSQFVVLLGGLVLAIFALGLAWQCVRLARGEVETG